MLTTGRAQDWDEFISPEERFSCNFPGKPTITETTWTSQFGAILPARVYSGTRVRKVSITVVDYNPIERLLSERSMSCTPGAETCQGIHDWGLGYWKNDVRGRRRLSGEQVLAARREGRQRDGQLRGSGVWGRNCSSRTTRISRASSHRIYMHDNRLIILEANVPKNYPPPTIFQQSLSWLDEKGTRIRYNNINYNDPDAAPTRIRGR
jgi:hypothetical protein